MARAPNRNTYNLRQHVTQYLSRENPESFSVPQIAVALYVIVGDVDITKALSNELQRRERAGYIAVIGSAEVGSNGGRPAKLYRQKWRV